MPLSLDPAGGASCWPGLIAHTDTHTPTQKGSTMNSAGKAANIAYATAYKAAYQAFVDGFTVGIEVPAARHKLELYLSEEDLQAAAHKAAQTAGDEAAYDAHIATRAAEKAARELAAKSPNQNTNPPPELAEGSPIMVCLEDVEST